MASCTWPPTNWTMAGAAAMQKPPIPAVSVMQLSPRSGLASASSNPGKYSPLTISAGAVNHASGPRPAMRIPKSVPLRHMVATTVEQGTSKTGSMVHLQAGIDRFRNVWSLLFRKASASICRSLGKSVPSTSGRIARRNRDVPALLRLWASSPIWSAWAIMTFISTSPWRSSAAFSTG